MTAARQRKIRRAWSDRHAATGLCRYCSDAAVSSGRCLKHLIAHRERYRKKAQSVRRHNSLSYRIENALKAFDGLSSQQRKVILLEANGVSRKEMGDIMKISAKTVQFHGREAEIKTGMNRQTLVRTAILAGK